jgi:hypothetical protein
MGSGVWILTSLRATLDKSPRSRDQWTQASLLVESFKLVPRPPLDDGPRPKSGKLRLNLHGTCFGGKINWFGPKNSAKKRAPDLIWRTENQARDQGTSPTQQFNLLQINPNWFLGPSSSYSNHQMYHLIIWHIYHMLIN